MSMPDFDYPEPPTEPDPEREAEQPDDAEDDEPRARREPFDSRLDYPERHTPGFGTDHWVI